MSFDRNNRNNVVNPLDSDNEERQLIQAHESDDDEVVCVGTRNRTLTQEMREEEAEEEEGGQNKKNKADSMVHAIS